MSNLVAGLHRQLPHNAGNRSGHLHRCFIGFEHHQCIVGRNGRTHRNKQLCDFNVAGVTDIWNDYFMDAQVQLLGCPHTFVG